MLTKGMAAVSVQLRALPLSDIKSLSTSSKPLGRETGCGEVSRPFYPPAYKSLNLKVPILLKDLKLIYCFSVLSWKQRSAN